MIRPIRSEADYRAGFERFEAIIDAKLGITKVDELEVLALLIEHYE